MANHLISVKITDSPWVRWAAVATITVDGVTLNFVPVKTCLLSGQPGLYPTELTKKFLNVLDEESKEEIRRKVHIKYLEHTQGHLIGTPIYDQAL